eukprot:scaffold12524_cov103-Isochrysis_galbana.AAC.2
MPPMSCRMCVANIPRRGVCNSETPRSRCARSACRSCRPAAANQMDREKGGRGWVSDCHGDWRTGGATGCVWH